MPISIPAMTLLDEDGFYNIYINTKYYCKFNQLLKHELTHIERDDFYNGIDIAAIEAI